MYLAYVSASDRVFCPVLYFHLVLRPEQPSELVLTQNLTQMTAPVVPQCKVVRIHAHRKARNKAPIQPIRSGHLDNEGIHRVPVEPSFLQVHGTHPRARRDMVGLSQGEVVQVVQVVVGAE